MVLGIDALPGLDLYEIVLFLVEFSTYLLAFNLILVTIVKPAWRVLTICLFPLTVLLCVTVVVITSYEVAYKKGFDLSQPSLREALESYIETGDGNLEEIIEGNKFAPVFGKYEVKYLMTDLMSHTLFHMDSHNEMNIPVSYNKGNDWFRATLGKPMIYTSAIYKNGNESLEQAQKYKLDYVANQIGLKAGDKVLDIGCGWGTLVDHFSTEYKADVTGITLSSEQVAYYYKEKHGGKKTPGTIMLQDAMKLLESGKFKPKSFDKITALEMAEHVGIRRYTEFLKIVKTLLKDDGVFYIQVAGLRRDWRWEDFVWGLFMGEHIFPGADASTPIGWVSTHLERAGFEVQQVNNLGSHYSKTLDEWLKEWRATKTDIVKNYGIKAFRRWEVFLRWSVRIARQGSSTVFMITTTKHNEEPTRIVTQKRLAPKL